MNNKEIIILIAIAGVAAWFLWPREKSITQLKDERARTIILSDGAEVLPLTSRQG